MRQDSAWLASLLARWTAVVVRRPLTVAAVVLAVSVSAGFYAAGHLGINTDTADMISAQLPWRQQFIAYRDAFPVRDRNIVVVIDADSAATADRFAGQLAETLAREPERYGSVFAAGSGEFFATHGLMYLEVAELEALSDRFVAAQPLLGLLSQRFNGAGTIDVVRRSVEADAGSGDLEPLYEELTRTLSAAADGRSAPLAWDRLIDAGADDSTRRLVVLRPLLDFARLQPAGDAIARLRDVVDAQLAATPEPVTVRLTGTVAMEHEEMQSVTRGVGVAGLAALAMVALVLYWALRSLRLLAISITSLLAGLACTAAFAAGAVGQLNLLSIAFAVLYVGLGVDFILHINLRVRELIAGGLDTTAAVVEAVRGVGQSLVICAVTTAAGFYAFIPTPFEGVAELGLISGTGMFVSLAVSLSLLPALLVGTLHRPLRMPRRAARQVRWKPLAQHPRLVVLATMLLMLATFTALPWVSFDSNPVHLRDPDSESVRVLQELAADSAAPLLQLVALADDTATAERWAERLRALPEVRAVNTLADLVPGRQQDKLALIEDLELVLGPGFADVERRAEEPAALAAGLTRLERSLNGLETRSVGQQRLAAAVARFNARLDDGSSAEAGTRLAALGAALTRGLPAELARLETALGARRFDREDLPAALRARWQADDGVELIEIVPAENIDDNAAAARFVSAVRDVVPAATGLPVVHQEASATVVTSFRLALTYAFVMVVVLLLLLLRRIGDTLLVVVPILFAAGATAGLTAIIGMPFNFANIIALPLLVGVGVDNGIHIVHRMRTEPPGDRDPLRTSTSRAVLASGLTTIASFGNLAWSTHVGMASMGALLTIGMFVTLFATLVLLPALLRIRYGEG